MATKLNSIYTIFQESFTEWISNAEPDNDYTQETDFRFDYWINYNADRDMARYDADKKYLIIVEPPKTWQILEPDAQQQQCDIDNELSIYVLQRGVKIQDVSKNNLMGYFSNCNDVLLEYLAAVKYWYGATSLRVFYPADVDLVFDRTVNFEIGVHATFKVKYY